MVGRDCRIRAQTIRGSPYNAPMRRTLTVTLLSLLLVAGRCSGPGDVPLGDLVLHVDTVSRRPLHRGRVELAFAATLRNPTAVDLGDVVVDASSRDRNAEVVEGRLRFPSLRAGETRAAVGRLVVRQHALRGPPRLAYVIASAAPPLVSSTPADGAPDFARTDWPVLQFASQPSAEVAAGLGLSCGGGAVPFAAHALAAGALLLNPAPDLPAGASCQLGWIGPGKTIHQLAFATAAAGAAAWRPTTAPIPRGTRRCPTTTSPARTARRRRASACSCPCRRSIRARRCSTARCSRRRPASTASRRTGRSCCDCRTCPIRRACPAPRRRRSIRSRRSCCSISRRAARRKASASASRRTCGRTASPRGRSSTCSRARPPCSSSRADVTAS